MSRRTHLVGLALLALVAGIPLAPAAGVDSTLLEWWGETDVGKGSHIRVPVTVENPYDVPIENGAVAAEIDIAAKLVAAGWVSSPRAGSDLLRSFELDTASIRVVGMTDLEAQEEGTVHGRLKVHDADIRSGPARYEVPSTYTKGSLAEAAQSDYHARTNPVVTVLWRVQDTLEPGAQRHYVVYLDSLTNIRHAPSEYQEARGGALLERTFWSGPGTDLVGLVQPQGSPGTVMVIGLHDGTTVEVLTGTPSGSFSHQVPPAGSHANPFTIGADEVRNIFISNTFGTPFRLIASAPILALVDSEGFVPTTSGDVVGHEFLFGTTYDHHDGQDSLFFVNHNAADPPEPTIVSLTPLDGGESQQVFLSHAHNQLPYTLGVPAATPQPQEGACVFPDSQQTARVPAGRAAYRAQVVSGGPVSLQFQPVRGATQIPASDSAPTGQHYWSTLSRSSATHDGGTCLRNTAQYGVYAAGTGAAELSIHSPESPSARVFPACASSPCGPGLAYGPVSKGTLDGQTMDTDDLFDRPLEMRTGQDSWVMVAPDAAASLANAGLRGPLGGGDAGRLFAGFGPTSVYAPYPNTVIEATLTYAASGAVEDRLRVVQGRLTPLPEREGDPLLWYTLDSDRPILVLPRGAPPGFLAGLPPMLEATVHGADFRGYLVEVESATGLDPVSRSAVPGEPVEYAFAVTNHGRSVGAGNLPDNIRLDTTPAPAGWTAELNRRTVQLDSGESATVRLTVTPSQDASPGDLGSIAVRATSQNNGAIQDSADTVTHIKRTAGVGLWFGCAGLGCPKALTQTGNAGEAIEYDVYVQNQGTVPDTLALEHTAPEGGWTAILLRDGVEASDVTLDAGAVARLVLQVTPPTGISEGILLTTLTAQSTSSPAVLDRIHATSKVQAPSALELDEGGPVRWTAPGEEAVFKLALSNVGEGTTEVFLGLSHDDLEGWSIPSMFMRGPHSGQRIPVDRLSLQPGDKLPLEINITPPPEAPAGQRHVIRLHVGTSEIGEGREAFLHTIVEPVHNISVVPPMLPLIVPRGDSEIPAEFRLTNLGNLNEFLTPAVSSLPPGWDVALPASNILVERNATQVLRLGIQAPLGIAEGRYVVAVELVSEDGNRTQIQVPVLVGSFLEHALAGPDAVQGQPGRVARVEHTIQNHGNTPLEVAVAAPAGEPWELLEEGPLVVPPRAELVLEIGWRVPTGEPDGITKHRAELLLRPESPDVDAVETSIEVEVDVRRPELRVVSADGFSGAAGSVIRAVVANDGARTAYGAHVELRVAGDKVDGVTIAEMPPGSTRNVTLLQPEGRPGPAIVLVNGDSAAREAEPVDNAVAVARVHAKESPIGLWLAMAGLLVASVCRRRARATAAGRPGGRT